MSENTKLTIDEGTIILVAAILKAERNADALLVPEARAAIMGALIELTSMPSVSTPEVKDETTTERSPSND